MGRASRAAYLAARPASKSPKDLAKHWRAAGLVREHIKQIPVVHLDDLLGDRKCQIRLRVMKYEDGMTPYHDVLVLLSILVAENPSEVLEIGTYMGHTARAMAENLETATIHTIDLPPDFSRSRIIAIFRLRTTCISYSCRIHSTLSKFP